MNPANTPAKGSVMTPFHIAVYHNTTSRFFPYEPGHALTEVLTHWRHLPADTSLEQIADWAYHVFNADLDALQSSRATAGSGELDFLLACTYRLLGMRSLSTGDVIGVTVEETTAFLACEFIGWRPIASPPNRTGRALSAETVYEHLRGGHA
jgi:hypothetical protein